MLFDLAVHDIEHSRFEKARLLLQTMMNTYDNSEYLAKAKLAVADSWYREGGAARHGAGRGRVQGLHPVLSHHGRSRRGAGEDLQDAVPADGESRTATPSHALRAEDECRQLLVQFPNSKFAPEAQQMLRNVQEVLADEEFESAISTTSKGSMPAAANRLQALADQFPLYSQADEALWELADSYRRMGDRFRERAGGRLRAIW